MMHVVPGPWLLALLNGVVLAVALGVAGYVLVERSPGATVADATWREEARELAREVQQTAEAAGTPADLDRVARRLLPLAGRIRSHVRAAPASADAGVYRRLFELGVACQGVATEQRPRAGLPDGVFLEDRLESLREAAVALETAAEPD